MYKIVLFVWGYSISGKIYATKEEALVPLEKLQEATRKNDFDWEHKICDANFPTDY